MGRRCEEETVWEPEIGKMDEGRPFSCTGASGLGASKREKVPEARSAFKKPWLVGGTDEVGMKA